MQSRVPDFVCHQIPVQAGKWCPTTSVQGAHPETETRTAREKAPLQSLEDEGGKERACSLPQVWHKDTERRRSAFREDMKKDLYAGDKVALTDDFNIATYSELLNSKITFFLKREVHVSFSSDLKPLSL